MLSRLQRRVAETFFRLPEASDFVLAGGGALIVRGVVDRITNDLDFFATTPEAVDRALLALERALEDEGFDCERVQASQGFARIKVSLGRKACLVDLGYDTRFLPSEPSRIGPTLASDELAADKVLALFGRAQARDFVDVFMLARVHGTSRLMELAKLKDSGFDKAVFADMLSTLKRLDDGEFEMGETTLEELRSFYSRWRKEIAAV